MGTGPAATVLGRRGSDAARISYSRSCLRPDGDALESRQDSSPHRGDGDRCGKGPRREEHAGTFPVITGLDHVVILVSDIAAGELAYQTLFARTPAWRNTGATADRIRAVLAEQGEGLASLCFRASDIVKMHRRLDRLTLKPEPVAEVES